MSASAILSVMMGGALNGASAIDAPETRMSGMQMPNDGVFAAMVEEAAQDEDSRQDTTAPALVPVAQSAPPMPLATGIMTSTALTDGLEAGTDPQTQKSDPAITATELGNTPFSALPAMTQDVNLVPEPSQSAAVPESAPVGNVTEQAVTHQDIAAPETIIPAAPMADTAQGLPLQAAQVTNLSAHSQDASTARAKLDPFEAILAKAAAPAEQELSEPQAEIASEQSITAREQAARDAVKAALPEHANLRAHLQANTSPQTHPLQPLRRLAENNGNALGVDDHATVTDTSTDTTARVETAAVTDSPPTAKAVAAADVAVPVAGEMAGETGIEARPLPSEPAIEAASLSGHSPADSKLSLANIRTTAEMAAQFITKMGQRVARFDMVLTPETLGTVDVSMEVGHDGQLQARMVFDTPAAANEMRARAEELRRQLAEAGFNVAENALEFTDRDSQSRGGFHSFFSDERPGRRAFAGANRLAQAADPISPPVWQSVTLTPRGVDMKV